MRIRLSVLILSVLLFAAGCGRSARHYLEAGDRLLAANKYEDASINYKKAIQKDVNLAEAYFGLGKSLLQQGKGGDAYATLSRAVELAPQNLEAKRTLANLTLGAYLNDSRRPKNLYEKLNLLADQFLAKDPNSFDGLRLKAYVAMNDNHPAEGIGYFRRALQAKPMETEIVLNLASVLVQDQATAAEGEQMVVNLIAKRKDAGQAYDLLYRHYSSTHRLAEAENILKAKVSANPLEANYLMQLAEHYRRTGKAAEMKATLDTLLSDSKNFPKNRLMVGDFYNRQDTRELALKYYEEGAQTAANDDKVLYLKRKTAVLVALGHPDRALTQLDASLQSNPKDQDLRMGHAVLLLDQRKVDLALEELQGLEKADDKNPVVKYHLGRALILKGHPKEANAKWQEAVKLRPGYIEPKIGLASYALDTGRFQETERLAEEILSRAPTNLNAQLLRANALQGLGKHADADTALTNLHKQFPGNFEVDLEFASLRLRENKPAEAEPVFRGLYVPGQDNMRPLTGLVEALLLQKRGNDAVRFIEADLAKVPGRPSVQFLLANTYAVTGHLDTALQTLGQLVAAHPNSVQGHLRLGELEASKGDLDRAVASFQRARELAPQSVEPVVRLAEVADRMGRVDVAKENYQAILKLDPANLMALNNLAFLDADTGSNLDEALRLIMTASQKVPKQPNFTDTLGYVYLKQKKTGSALQLFGSLTQQYPANATFRFHHALALLESGSKDRAKKEFEAALAAKPSADLAAKIRAALGRAG